MAPKYTLSKVLLQTSNKGFTIIELLVGLIIMCLIGGFAMDALVSSSKAFNTDKKNIENSQNLSTILEVVGSDIKEAGEQIGDSNFPTIEISQNTTDAADTANNSSTIIVRRAVSTSLTLCENIAIGANPTTLIVADTAQTATDAGCTPVFTTPTAPIPTLVLPDALRAARNYRCQLDNSTETTGDFCQGAVNATEKVRAVVSDTLGHFRSFKYIDDDASGGIAKYKINIENISTDPRNNVAYSIGKPIYLIDERIYQLDRQGNLTVSLNGEARSILSTGIAKFKVSAKLYKDPTTKTIQDTPTATQNPCAASDEVYMPTPVTAQDPIYACKFNSNTNVADAAYNWKTLAGIRVELRANYDPTGSYQQANVSQAIRDRDNDKLSAKAEYFPRNVLSR